MKLFLITLFISIPCFAENSSWPLDNEKNLPSLLDPQKPYIDIIVEENKYLENISNQIIEHAAETSQQETLEVEDISEAPAVEE